MFHEEKKHSIGDARVLGALYFRIHMSDNCLRNLGGDYECCMMRAKQADPHFYFPVVCPKSVHDENLEKELLDAEKFLGSGKRVAIITFHDANHTTLARTIGVVEDITWWLEHSFVHQDQIKIAEEIVIRRKANTAIKDLIKKSLQLPHFDPDTPPPNRLCWEC